MLDRVTKIKDLVHELVDKGVSTVEEIHLTIAQASREGLEEVAPKEVKPLVETATEIHNTATSSVYETIRSINHKVSDVSDEVLARIGEASRQAAESSREAVEPEESKEAQS